MTGRILEAVGSDCLDLWKGRGGGKGGYTIRTFTLMVKFFVTLLIDWVAYRSSRKAYQDWMIKQQNNGNNNPTPLYILGLALQTIGVCETGSE